MRKILNKYFFIEKNNDGTYTVFGKKRKSKPSWTPGSLGGVIGWVLALIIFVLLKNYYVIINHSFTNILMIGMVFLAGYLFSKIPRGAENFKYDRVKKLGIIIIKWTIYSGRPEINS